MVKENKLMEFLVEYDQAICVSYNKGNWVVENSEFYFGSDNCKIKVQGIATTLESAVDNFLYNLLKTKKNLDTTEVEYV